MAARKCATATLSVHRPSGRPTSGIPSGLAETDSAAPAAVPPIQTPVSAAHSDTTFRPVGAIVGWLFPGLGHIAAGNTKRGILAMSGVLMLFFGGILVGGVDCVDRREDGLWFVGQAGCGPIAFAASYANDSLLKSGAAAPMIEMPSLAGEPKNQVSSFKGLAHANEFGTLFVFLAGLLNVCVLLDAAVREPSSDRPSSGRRSGEGTQA